MQSPQSSATDSATGGVSSGACQNCSRAKAKCVSQPDHRQCTRCLRLKKECLILPKSTRKRRSPNSAKTAQLEQKIESLVTLLSATQTALPTHLSSVKYQPLEPLPRKYEAEDERRPGHRPAFSWAVEPPVNTSVDPPSWCSSLCGRQHSTALTPSSTTTLAPSTQEPESTPSVDLQVEDPDRLLKIYREYYEVDFPFIIIPPNVTSQELKAKRPWLTIAICMVASHGNRIQQLALAKQIIMEVAAALFIRSEKSLDMLEGLIVYNVWQYYYSPSNPQYQSSAVIQLVLAVLFDLGLNKPLRENDGPEMLQDTFKLATENMKELRRPSQERRAFVICFMITTGLSTRVQRIDGLEHTPYFDSICQSLFEAAEFESDLILVFMARCHAVVASVHRNTLNGGLGSTEIKAPASMLVTSAKADLQSYLTALPPHLQEHTLVRRCYHSAETFFSASSLHRSMFPGNLNSQRLDMLYACSISAKSFLDKFLTLPISRCNSMSVTTLSEFGHTMSTAFKLCFIEVPGWDLAYIRETIDLPHYLEVVISRFEQIGAQVDNSQAIPAKRSFCSGAALAMGRVKGWYENKVAADVERRQQEEQTGLAGIEDIFTGDKFDYFDDSYLMGDWNWEEIMSGGMQE